MSNVLRPETAAGLPVRERYTDAELAVMSQFMDEHGDDPQAWPHAVVLAYAATIAQLRWEGSI